MISLDRQRPRKYRPQCAPPGHAVYGYHGSYGVWHSIRHSLRNPRVRRGQLHYGRVVDRKYGTSWRLSSRLEIARSRRKKES